MELGTNWEWGLTEGAEGTHRRGSHSHVPLTQTRRPCQILPSSNLENAVEGAGGGGEVDGWNGGRSPGFLESLGLRGCRYHFWNDTACWDRGLKRLPVTPGRCTLRERKS